MKKLMISILAIVVLVVIATPISARMSFDKLIIEEDEFTGIISKKMSVECSGFSISAANTGNNHLCLLIVIKNDSWEYLKCNKVHFLIDGKRLSPKTIYDGLLETRYVLEFIEFHSIEDVKQILMGTKIKFRICNDIFEIPAEKLKLLKQILN